MRTSILSLILLLGTGIAYAQQSSIFSGRVLDSEHREPLIGALVSASEHEATVTDADGYFSLEITDVQHTITISYLGYESKEITPDQQNPDAGEITLELSTTTLDEIVVSASPRNYKRQFKGSNFRINPIAIQNINPLNTEEVLRTVPGVNIVGDMGLSNRPNISIRGSWGRRSKKILLLEDGSPAAPAPYIAPGTYYNPVSDRVTSIEVYKGADMLRYGPNNMYGAVNYITALPPQQPELRVKLAGGQRNYSTALLSYGGTWNNLGALVEGVYKSFDGFTNNSSVEILNLNAKIFAKLSEEQSLYFKVSAQFEDNQASLSSQTPFTFDLDPTQNPLDADQFTMRRYGLDIIHKWLPKENLSFTTKVYASDFERDWWRQITAKVRAADLESYLGEEIFNTRYSYLTNVNYGPEDYVIVGRVEDGHESTSDSRWAFTVTGIKENINYKWNTGDNNHNLEAGLKYHYETYKDRFLVADSSRWARSGSPTTDLKYGLWSFSSFLRNEFNFGRIHVTPIVRFEHIDMYRQDVLALASDPDINNIKEGRETNTYNVVLPGLTLEYDIKGGEFFGSIYRGFIAPSKVFGFLVEKDGIVTNPLAGESINIQPELSLNTEIGWRGSIIEDKLDGQATYFNNTVHNFYAGGRNEVFEELGKINIQGLEIALSSEVYKTRSTSVGVHANLTWLNSRLIQGKLNDRDLFGQIVFNDETRNEYIDKVNSNRNAYEIYMPDANGEDVLFSGQTLTLDDFNKISKALVIFGKDGVSDAKAPYSPPISVNGGVDLKWQHLSLGVSGNYVAEQYTEFNNFTKESADGAIGKLPAFFTVDAYLNYDFRLGRKVRMNAFINGKNLTNNIYRASRLNRATSGVFPGGFRQLIFGINMTI